MPFPLVALVRQILLTKSAVTVTVFVITFVIFALIFFNLIIIQMLELHNQSKTK